MGLRTMWRHSPSKNPKLQGDAMVEEKACEAKHVLGVLQIHDDWKVEGVLDVVSDGF